MRAWDRVRALVDGLGPAFLIGLAQAALGLALLLRYEADPARAHESVRAIAAGGLGFVRSLHSALATALVVLVLVNLARVWTRPFAPTPRDWATRIALAGLVLVAFQTGGVLAWDQRGWESYQHMASMTGMEAERPEEARLFWVAAAHAAAVPIALGLLALVRPAWRHRLAALRLRLPTDVVPAVSVLALVALLALLAPRPLGPAPIAGVSLTRPEWPFLWLVPLQEWLGAWGLAAGVLAALGVAAAAPFVARGWTRGRRAIALWAAVGLFLVLETVGASM